MKRKPVLSSSFSSPIVNRSDSGGERGSSPIAYFLACLLQDLILVAWVLAILFAPWRGASAETLDTLLNAGVGLFSVQILLLLVQIWFTIRPGPASSGRAFRITLTGFYALAVFGLPLYIICNEPEVEQRVRQQHRSRIATSPFTVTADPDGGFTVSGQVGQGLLAALEKGQASVKDKPFILRLALTEREPDSSLKEEISGILRLLHDAKATTQVEGLHACENVCAFLYLAGARRLFEPSSSLSFAPLSEDLMSLPDQRAFLEGTGIERETIEALFAASPATPLELSWRTMQQTGIVTAVLPEGETLLRVLAQLLAYDEPALNQEFIALQEEGKLYEAIWAETLPTLLPPALYALFNDESGEKVTTFLQGQSQQLRSLKEGNPAKCRTYRPGEIPALAYPAAVDPLSLYWERHFISQLLSATTRDEIVVMAGQPLLTPSRMQQGRHIVGTIVANAPHRSERFSCEEALYLYEKLVEQPPREAMQAFIALVWDNGQQLSSPLPSFKRKENTPR